MEIEYSGIDESLVKWRYNTEPWHTAYITDLIAKWESDKAKENTFVKHISTVAVRPVVYGKWIDHKCSVCVFEPYNPRGLDTFNFCSNCGADMSKESE